MGLILDTSVLITAEQQRFRLSELFAVHPQERFFITAITASELLHGVERAIPPERKAARRLALELKTRVGTPMETPRQQVGPRLSA